MDAPGTRTPNFLILVQKTGSLLDIVLDVAVLVVPLRTAGKVIRFILTVIFEII